MGQVLEPSSGKVLSVNTSNGVIKDGDDVELDYEVITSGSFSGTVIRYKQSGRTFVLCNMIWIC